MINITYILANNETDYVFKPTRKIIMRPGDKPPPERPIVSRASIPSSLRQHNPFSTRSPLSGSNSALDDSLMMPEP